MSEQDMIERYIYEVTRRVPPETRDEICMELKGLIDDMCAAEGCSVEEALQRLGNPAEFAKRYREDNNYLIGPEYYDNYIWLLKIALIGIGISAVISAIVQGILGAENWGGFFTGFFTELFTTFINGAISMVGVVTIIFAILERQKVKVAIKPEETWSVNDLTKNAASAKSWTPHSLPPVPDKRAIINRSESIASIVFLTTFAALLLFAPQLFGAFHYDGSKLESVACIFNLNEWNTIAPVFVFCLLTALVDEVIRLITGCYCKPVMYSNMICNALQVTGAVILLKFMPLFNMNFAAQIQAYEGITEFSNADILRYWGNDFFANLILAFICVISCIEVAVTVYKTLRYA